MASWTPEQRSQAVDAILVQAPVLPVIAIRNLEDAVPLARALVAGGLPVLEVTLRSAVAHALPDISETSRSLLSPPLRTATCLLIRRLP